jgi:16S rRNA (guanine(527)-N(7))-methyltransferase RsmG
MPAHNPDDIRRIVESIPGVHQRLNVDLLRIFLGELLAWNSQLGLVSKQDTPSVTANVIRRCVEMWKLIGRHVKDSSHDELRNVADIGSGAGFPGLIWKLMAPDLRVTLIERKSRRVFFLERVVGQLGLQDVTILGTDLRELVREPDARETFDLAAMLAVAPPERIGNDAERLLGAGGYLVTTQASTDPAAAVVGGSLHLVVETPLSGGVFLLYQKHSQ